MCLSRGSLVSFFLSSFPAVISQGYNITNKRVLNWLPLPWFVSWVQLLFGVVYCMALWAVKLRKRPTVPKEGVKALSIVALCHTIGHVSTVCSLGAVAVSYVGAMPFCPLCLCFASKLAPRCCLVFVCTFCTHGLGTFAAVSSV